MHVCIYIYIYCISMSVMLSVPGTTWGVSTCSIWRPDQLHDMDAAFVLAHEASEIWTNRLLFFFTQVGLLL